MVLFDGKVLGTILRNVYIITLGIDIGTYLGSLDGSYDGSNDNQAEDLLLGDSLISTDGKVLGSYELIKLGLSYGGVIFTILGNIYVITLGIDVGTQLGSLDGFFDGSNNGNIENLLP